MRSLKVSNSSFCIVLIYCYVSPGSGIGQYEQASATNIPWVTSLMGFWTGSPVPSIFQLPNNKFMERYNSIRGSSVMCEYVCFHIVIVTHLFYVFANGNKATQVGQLGHSTDAARTFFFAARC